MRSYWSDLDMKRQIAVLLALAVMIGAVVMLARSATAPGRALLYAGLEPGAAGEVVTALEQRGLSYEVRGDAIWVESGQRDQLRMSLAAEGLPATGGGYELLDQLSGFGTTAQMFDAAHLRAKEGELARTIAASPFVRHARVHIAQASPQAFRRTQKVTASVTITSRAGSVTPAQAQAIRHLVAAAVTGLVPDEVSVIDSSGGLVPLPSHQPGGAAEGRAAEMKRAVERLLAARVGPNGALVEVALDVETNREEITERRFDPQGRVAVSTESEARSSSSSGVPPGVTVASNLPEGDASGGERNHSQGNESRERVNYEISETARELHRPAGGIRRLTVAVLVDGVRDAEGAWQPRGEAELADLRELVSAAVGYDAERGDVISLKSLEFGAAPEGAPPEGLDLLSRLDVMLLLQLAITALVILALGLFVVRPLLLSQKPRPLPLALPPAGRGAAPALTGELEDKLSHEGVLLPGPRHEAGEPVADPVARLRHLIGERQAESVEILRSWMDDREEGR